MLNPVLLKGWAGFASTPPSQLHAKACMSWVLPAHMVLIQVIRRWLSQIACMFNAKNCGGNMGKSHS